MPPTFQPLGSTPTDIKAQRLTATDGRLTRTQFFDGKLLTAHDLTREQTYLDQRLRDIGRAGGDGVVAGLVLTFDRERMMLEVSRGLAVSLEGRAITLDDDLEVDLGDRARMRELNGGRSTFASSLFAVVLVHAEFPSAEVAEIFPTDLGVERGSSPDAIVEGAEVVLVPLRMSLSVSNELPARRDLASELLARNVRALPTDGVALGVLAVDKDVPAWIDAELLRHPLRVPGDPVHGHDDLARHYARLLDDVERSRIDAAPYAAAAYFHSLPSFGRAPKVAFDPAQGTQRWFRADDDVTISIVRDDELATLADDARRLDPLDLRLDGSASLLVVAALPATTYASFAAELELDSGLEPGDPLPFMRPRRLLASRRSRRNGVDTDEATWTKIWEAVGVSDVYYVRRAPRPAMTAPSGILIAAGASSADGATVRQLRDRVTAAKGERDVARQALEDALEKLKRVIEKNVTLGTKADKARAKAEKAVEDRADAERALEKANDEVVRLGKKVEELEAKLAEAGRKTKSEREKRLGTEGEIAKRDKLLGDKDTLLAERHDEIRELLAKNAALETEKLTAEKKSEERHERALVDLKDVHERALLDEKRKLEVARELSDKAKGDVTKEREKRTQLEALVSERDRTIDDRDRELVESLAKAKAIATENASQKTKALADLRKKDEQHEKAMRKAEKVHALDVRRLNEEILRLGGRL